MREAATIKGALRHGEVIDVEQVPKLDLILSRVGRGQPEGRADRQGRRLQRPRVRAARGGAARCRTRRWSSTTVHPIQILRENLPVTTHDIPVDLIATPRAAIEVERAYKRPTGILWDHLQPPQIHEIPVLERMGYA